MTLDAQINAIIKEISIFKSILTFFFKKKYYRETFILSLIPMNFPIIFKIEYK